MPVHAGVHMQVHRYTHLHTNIHAYIDTYAHTYIPAYIHMYMHACMHACRHTYIHTYIHTHIQRDPTISVAWGVGSVYSVGCRILDGMVHTLEIWGNAMPGKNCSLPWEWGRELPYSVFIVVLHQHASCRAWPLCWATVLSKCTVMATAWQAWQEDKQWPRRKHSQRRKCTNSRDLLVRDVMSYVQFQDAWGSF